ncbi:MAG: endo-1,4-beta-xylanase [Candidatus Marinimicrobia bacterium]|nr:endo-1,4-beta-xylanase [Candidatus Neomarinimicrobiota bacterium]
MADWAFATDENWDTFHSDIHVDSKGIKITKTPGVKKFGINVRWNVEGFGYNDYTADNGGEYYTSPGSGKKVVYNLNFELALSRIVRNRRRLEKFKKEDWQPSKEAAKYIALSETLLEDARKKKRLSESCGELSQGALYYALHGSEMFEMEKVDWDIEQQGGRTDFLFGCDARAYYEMSKDLFMEYFPQLFDLAALTYVVNGDPEMNVFEPKEGQLNFKLRDVLYKDLKKHNVQVEGRLLFWFHKWVTPDWLKNKNYDQLKKYVEQHTREVLSHYGNGMYLWEIVNEFHDWANEVQLNPEQIVELTKFACEVARDTVPDMPLMVNNCCPFGEYVHLGKWSGQKSKYPQRTPHQFIKDLIEADVDFDIIGQQLYYQYRDLQDFILILERYEELGKKVQISEIGATSGPSNRSVKIGSMGIPEEPYPWHRPWDEKLQADWAEAMFKIGYSKPYVNQALWFDFIDAGAFYDNGGLLKDKKRGKQKKAIYNRLFTLRKYLKGLT